MTRQTCQPSGVPLLDATTLDSALAIASRNHPQASVHYPATAEKLTCAELDRAATRCAHALRRHGVARGHLVGIIQGTDAGLLPRLFGVLRTGAAASALPSPHGVGGTPSVVRRIGRIMNGRILARSRRAGRASVLRRKVLGHAPATGRGRAVRLWSGL